MTSGNSRRLVVLRHAKSAWPLPADHERPLAPCGRPDAPAAGHWLREAGCVPDLVVCSSARRVRQTWDLVAAEAEFGASTPVIYEVRLYGASADELLSVVREIPAPAGSSSASMRRIPPWLPSMTSYRMRRTCSRYALRSRKAAMAKSSSPIPAYPWRRPATDPWAHLATLMPRTTTPSSPPRSDPTRPQTRRVQ